MQDEKLHWLTASTGGNCVEVAALPGGGVAVRDSKDRAGAVLTYTRDEWRVFVDGVHRGVFDRLG
ncbi:MAG TPA: DUF397 domain-containing protein [Mycobacteriales bacterium]|nr:DUF397 domain-containing protein [Mycobacteriales bacterium]